jgi:predicted phage terminase large subunit-like protein
MYDPGPHVVVLVSKTSGHAIRLLDTIKNVLDYSKNFRTIYGYWGEHTAKTWKQDEIILKNGSSIICKGTGQQVVGLKVGNQRPTLIVLDDPEDMTNTKTPEAMEYNMRWLLQSLVPARDPQKGKVVVVGTPQHQSCMVEELHRSSGWHSVRYQAILENDESKWTVEDNPDVLWPAWNSAPKLIAEFQSLKSMGKASSFYREYQCVVTGDEDQLFKAEYFNYHDHQVEHVNGNTYLRKGEELIPVNIFIGVDPASSVSQTADFSVIMPIAMDENRNIYVLPYFRKRVSPMDLADAIVKYFKMYKPKRTTIESTGYQEMLRSYLRSLSDVYIPGLETKVTPRNSKSSRLETLQPYFYKKRVYLHKDQNELRTELLDYPRGSHDDTLDGLYYAMLHSYVPSHKAPDKQLKVRKNIDKYLLGTAKRDDSDWMLS